MYAYFKGELVEKNPSYVLIECNGVAYQLQMGPALSAKIPPVGEIAKVFAYFYVGQDRQELFGFPDMNYKRLFEMLIQVNGVGPKAALAILEVFSPEEFAVHVLHNDAKAITKAKGVGKKGAERLILELRDKVKQSTWVDALPEEEVSSSEEEKFLESDEKLDIVEGLVYLGYPPHTARKLVQATYVEGKSIEENLRNAMAAAQ